MIFCTFRGEMGRSEENKYRPLWFLRYLLRSDMISSDMLKIRSLAPLPPRTQPVRLSNSRSLTLRFTHSLTRRPVEQSVLMRSLLFNVGAPLKSNRTSSGVSTVGKLFSIFAVLMLNFLDKTSL